MRSRGAVRPLHNLISLKHLEKIHASVKIVGKFLAAGRNSSDEPIERPARKVDSVLAERPEQDDIDLLHRSARGNARAFGALTDRHADRLFRLAFRLVGNAADAEDVLQEALCGAYRSSGRFEGRSSVKTWLTKILVAQAALWRRSRRKTEPIDEGAAARPARPDVAIDVQEAIRKISAEHQEVLLLREFENLTYDEMAEVLSVPRGTIESRLHRARQELKERLKSYLP